MHARRTVVLAVVAALTPLADDEIVTAVQDGRAAPLPIAKAPYVMVYGRQERSAPLTMAGPARKLEREVVVAVEIVAASEGDEAVEALAEAVEAAIAADPTLGGACKDLWLSATTLDARIEGQSRAGTARLEFTVSYHTRANNPSAAV